jgi:hypothetical protein
MSDPYAGTVTVRNILNHIISPKIVNDAFSGYVTKIDLVNVDRLVLNSGSGNGTEGNPFTGQCGRITVDGSLQIFHRDVTPNSIILVSNSTIGTPVTQSFTVTTSSSVVVSWFIVKF